MSKWPMLGATMVLGLLGCGSDSSSTTGPARTCATDIAVGEVQPFADPLGTFSEGLTFDGNGALFVSARPTDADDQLLRFAADGSSEVAAESESLLGLASHDDGILAASIETGELLLIDPETGSSEVIASELGEPNFVVTTPWGTTLVSDDRIGTSIIREVTLEGDVSVWSDGVPTPNGMVFSLDNRTLYVAATFDDPGLWRVPVSEDGEAGAPEKWVTFEGGVSTPDGVAIDSEGNVYVALNLKSEIAQVKPDGTVAIIAQGVASAASIAFGRGEFDPCSIYATSLFGEQLSRVGIGILGTEN